MKQRTRKQQYEARALYRIRRYKHVMAERLKESKRLFGHKVYAVDIHTHSNYSDGAGTVADNYSFAKKAGLDFIFATDHYRIAQRSITRRWKDASWGQEPGISGSSHHIGVLCNERVFRPTPGTLEEVLAAARKIAPFAWIPHPVGWYPDVWYSDESIAELWGAGASFAMEIMNGAIKVLRAYDEHDAKAVATWDRLLSDGRRITALAASDAHCPDDIGTAWTGVFVESLTPQSIIKSLNAGHCFASESALLDFSINSRPMGSTIRAKKGSKLKLKFKAVDAAGIARVRIVSQGKLVREIDGGREKIVQGSLEVKAGARPTYYRLESQSSDDLRAFSTPIYAEPSNRGGPKG